MSFDGNSGVNKLANILSERIHAQGKQPLYLDFGEIQSNGSLVTNTFPVSIPKGQYTLCRQLSGLSFELSGNPDDEQSEQQNLKLPPVKSGDRVLVAWVNSEAVVIDVIVGS